MNNIYAMSQKGSCSCFVETIQILLADAKKLKKTSNFDVLLSIFTNTVLDALQKKGIKFELSNYFCKLHERKIYKKI